MADYDGVEGSELTGIQKLFDQAKARNVGCIVMFFSCRNGRFQKYCLTDISQDITPKDFHEVFKFAGQIQSESLARFDKDPAS